MNRMKILCTLLLGCMTAACSGGSGRDDAGTDFCEGISCSDHGNCVLGQDGAECQCEPGYHPEGLSCIEDGTTGPCYQVTCSHHGICVDKQGLPYCQCDPGYHAEGLSCVEDPDPCDGIDCSGHGYCVHDAGVPDCVCDTGYHNEGLNCVEDGTTGPCDGVTCSGHGECVDNQGVPECHCHPGYHAEGLACIEDPDPCRDVTCSYHGTCVLDAFQNPVCICDPGYHAEGLYCVQDPDDPCQGVTCSYHGTCVLDAFQNPMCDCDPGYHAEGLTCVEDVDPCEGVTCSGYGTCIVVDSQPECQCDEGYEPEGLECVETWCHCWENNRPHWSMCSYAQACQTAADCCPANVPEPFACNQDYPYIYQCVGGQCSYWGCHQDSNCSAYFEWAYGDLPGNWRNDGCQEYYDECTGELTSAYCLYSQLCTSAADCCPDTVTEPYVCNQDYPYVYRCDEGICRNAQCTTDSHCDKYFGLNYDYPWVNQGCIDTVDPCSDEVWYSTCAYRQPCSSAADCCPDYISDPYQCNVDYPYVYECQDSWCATIYCANDAQCDTYFEQVHPEPDGWINLGCVEY